MDLVFGSAYASQLMHRMSWVTMYLALYLDQTEQ